MVSTGTEEGGYAFLNSRMHGRGSDILEKFRFVRGCATKGEEGDARVHILVRREGER